MKKPTTPISQYLLAFLLWLGIALAVFYLGFTFYAQAVLFLAEYVLGWMTPVSVDLNYASHLGITLAYPGIAQPMVFRANLFSITLNWIFAPALVLTTVTFSFLGLAAQRVLGAILIMLIFHVLHVDLILLHFLTSATNPLIPPGFSPFLAKIIHWLYFFVDKMGYTLFPFIAWFAVCFKDIMGLFTSKPENDRP